MHTNDRETPKELQASIKRLHKQMRAADAAGGVDPPPVINRRTGEKTEFGPRRDYDGAWLLEMLAASGCTDDDVRGAMFVLEPLIEASWKVDEDLLELLSDFHERPTPKLTVVK